VVAVVAAVMVWTMGVVPVAAAPPVLTDVIIQFNPGTNARAQAADLAARGGRVSQVYENVFPGVAASLPAAAINALGRNPQVAVVEADGVVTTTTTSGTQASPVWGLDRSDQRALPLSRSYSWVGDGAGVTAYIVDTGIRADHVDFGGRVGAGYTAINDGRGTGDCNGHGTHVAATTAGITHGMAKAATVVPVRVLDCAGSGSWSGVIAGLDWIVRHHVNGPAVANMSLGGGASTTVDNAVRAVIADGVTVAVAAGNANANACNYSPARTPEALTVGATTSTDARASYSNTGQCLDLFAPGSSVRSAWYTSATATATLNGTSMASPHVAGAVAMMLSLNPALTPADVADAIVGEATTGVVSNPGARSPNRLLFASPVVTTPVVEPEPAPEPSPEPAPEQPAASVPEAPGGVTASATGNNSATVAWTQNADGGSPLTAHTVVVFQGRRQVATVTVDGSATTAQITGLKSRTTFTFRVSATNAVGTSPLSAASNAVTTAR
jgi:subtilisin family serine protease